MSSNYTSIKEGVNEITAKTCLPAATKWYSVNVTGVATTQNTTATTMTSPQMFTSDQEELGPKQPLPVLLIHTQSIKLSFVLLNLPYILTFHIYIIKG